MNIRDLFQKHSKILPTPNFWTVVYIKKDQYVHPIDIPSMWLKKSFINVYYIILLNYHTVIVMAWSYFQLSHVKYWVRATKSHNMVRVSTADPPTHTARSLLSFLMFTLIFTSEMVSDLKLPKPEEREKNMHTQTYLQCRFDSALSQVCLWIHFLLLR